MKIKRIFINNNPILWNISLDFTKLDWSVVDTVILIWENWSWKSTLLNIIYKFCCLDNPELSQNEKREFIVELNHPDFWSWEFSFLFDKNYNSRRWGDGSWYNNFKISIWSNEVDVGLFMQSIRSKELMKWIYSDVSINFTTSDIAYVTNLNTDETITTSIKSGSDTAQKVKQLFVDIFSKDSEDLQNWVDDNPWVKVPEEVNHIRLKRFSNAFNYMFADEWLEFIWSKWLIPIFKKNWWNDIWIDQLSSWEKQIAYRWWFLLKDKNSLSDSIVLIDEPEISMHPRRQEKALNFYKNLFRTGWERIVSQIFVTTHSPYILNWLDFNTDRIFTFPWWRQINNIKKYIWNYPSIAVINYKVFGVPTTDLFNELYWYIQIRLEHSSLSQTDEQFKQRWIEKNKIWKKEDKRSWWEIAEECTIFTYIRNYIHHPENPYNNECYTKEELIDSIEKLINIIDGKHI